MLAKLGSPVPLNDAKARRFDAALHDFKTTEGFRAIMSADLLRERECMHRSSGAPGEFYKGATYVQYLQRLRSDMAVEAARKVTPFFWSDARHIIVWLCRDCAQEIGLPVELGIPEEPPRYREIYNALR